MTLTHESAARKDRVQPSGNRMEHRRFAEIARIIRAIRRPSDGQGSESYFRADSVANHFADELAHTSPRFDRKRFLAACKN